MAIDGFKDVIRTRATNMISFFVWCEHIIRTAIYKKLISSKEEPG
jgi:hypothetical protein